ncbi:MAG: Mur ligase domain-containing protein, partial [Armatimonadaceae bacterium]
MIRLSELAALSDRSTVSGDIAISGVRQDSRAIEPGDLFVAIHGQRFDGHDLIGEAVARGAVAIAVEHGRSGCVPDGVPFVAVPSTRASIATWAVRVYGDPTRRLHVTGVTGTNGKTTTVRLVDAIARAAGEVTGTVGTLG